MVEDDVRVAVIVNPALAAGALANTIATISIGLGAALPMLGGTRLDDQEGRTIDVSANRPTPILQAAPETLSGILLKALENREGRVVTPFPAFARSLHAFSDYEAALKSRNLAGEIIDGVGLAGPGKWVRSLTGALKLLR